MNRLVRLSAPLLLGFEEIGHALERAPGTAQGLRSGEGYPPYDVERFAATPSQAERIRVTLAVSGFALEELEVSLEANRLLVRGRQSERRDRSFLHRGIATRQFQKSFLLASGIEILAAELKDGLLAIDLVRPIGCHPVRKIEISGSA